MKIKNTIILTLLAIACFLIQDIAGASCTPRQRQKICNVCTVGALNGSQCMNASSISSSCLADGDFNKYLKFPYLITLKNSVGDLQFVMRSNGVDTKNTFIYNLYGADGVARVLGVAGHTYYESINFLLPTNSSVTLALNSNYCVGTIEESGTIQGICEVIFIANQAGNIQQGATSFTASPQ